MEEKKSSLYGFKLLFSAVSFFLLIPSLKEDSYYRILYMFLINRIFDKFIAPEESDLPLFIGWGLVNQWVGIIVCAFSFCMMITEFRDVVGSHSDFIKAGFLVFAGSIIGEEYARLVTNSIKGRMMQHRILKQLHDSEENDKL